MSDIRFACPFCQQHIVCDADYGGLSIDCPSCRNKMIVPRLSAAAPDHPSMLVLASTPAPDEAKPKTPEALPTLRAWTEAEWSRHSREVEGDTRQMPNWVAVFFGSLMIAFALKLGGAGTLAATACVLAGGVAAAVLFAKGGRSRGAYRVLTGIGLFLAVICLLPVLGLAILFVGCAACSH
jgi:Flp pilus assembly protein TadB